MSIRNKNLDHKLEFDLLLNCAVGEEVYLHPANSIAIYQGREELLDSIEFFRFFMNVKDEETEEDRDSLSYFQVNDYKDRLLCTPISRFN